MALQLRDLGVILETNIDLGQVLLGIAAILVAIPAVWATMASKKNSRKLDDLHDKTETGNGKNLGKTVHDLAATSASIQTQLTANTVESARLAQRAELAATKAEMAALVDSRVEFLVGAINAKLDSHIIESRVVQERLIKVLKEGGEADV